MCGGCDGDFRPKAGSMVNEVYDLVELSSLSTTCFCRIGLYAILGLWGITQGEVLGPKFGFKILGESMGGKV